MKLFTYCTCFAFALVGQMAMAADWDFSPKVYIGWMQPGGDAEKNGGLVLGGQGDVSVEGTVIQDPKTRQDKIAMLVFAGLKGEGLGNGDPSKGENDIKFSAFDLNAGLAIGPNGAKWKWRTPVNIDMNRDIVTNEGFGVRYAFSGLQVRFLDREENGDRAQQILELVSDVVIAHFSYASVPQRDYPVPPACDPNTTVCEPYNPDPSLYPAYDRTIFGLYSKINYEIQKRGWGGQARIEVTQALTRNYTKADASVVAFKQFSGNLRNLRFFAELRGTVDYDTVDPVSKVQGAGRATVGFSSKF